MSGPALRLILDGAHQIIIKIVYDGPAPQPIRPYNSELVQKVAHQVHLLEI